MFIACILKRFKHTKIKHVFTVLRVNFFWKSSFHWKYKNNFFLDMVAHVFNSSSCGVFVCLFSWECPSRLEEGLDLLELELKMLLSSGHMTMN